MKKQISLTESQLRNIVKESVIKTLNEMSIQNRKKQQIYEGKISDFWFKIKRNSENITYNTLLSLLVGLLVAHLGLFTSHVVSRSQIIKQCRQDFIERYQVDPDTLKPGDKRLFDFAEYEINKLKQNKVDYPGDYIKAHDGGRISTFYNKHELLNR